MAVRATLDTLVEALQMQNDEGAAYFDGETGEVYFFTHEVLGSAEAGSRAHRKLPDWQRSEIALARRVLAGEGDRYRALPSAHDVHEWRIMEAFCNSIANQNVREDFLAAIHARGAFRNFAGRLARHQLRESWFGFRDRALREIAVEWCRENEIAFEEGEPAENAVRTDPAEGLARG